MGTLNCDGLRGSDLRAAVKGTPTPKVDALLSMIRRHQVVALQDTAGLDEKAMQQLLAPTHVWMWRAPASSGKGKGVGFAVATNLAALCSIERASDHGGLVWLKCDGQLFSSAQPVFVANVYAPTVGQNHTLGEYAQRMEELLDQTIELNLTGPHVWLGDFNADVWDGSELPEGGGGYLAAIKEAPELHRPRKIRGAAPCQLKQQAKLLLNTAAAAGSLLLTGRKGDSGQASYHSVQGWQSRIDHIAVHAELWRVVEASSVENTGADLSDHKPVTATFCAPLDQKIDIGSAGNGTRLPGAFGFEHLTWKPERAEEYSLHLQQEPAFKELGAAIGEKDDDKTASLLAAAILAAARKCGMVRAAGPHSEKRGKGKQQQQQRPPWWDSEVQAAYNNMRDSSISAAPGWVRKEARSRFKSTARRQRRRHMRYLAAAVADRLAKHDSKVFKDQLQERRQKCPPTAISAAAWQEQLSNQFTATEPPRTQPKPQPTGVNQQGLGVSAATLNTAFQRAFGRMREHTATGMCGVAAAFIKNAVVHPPPPPPHTHTLTTSPHPHPAVHPLPLQAATSSNPCSRLGLQIWLVGQECQVHGNQFASNPSTKKAIR